METGGPLTRRGLRATALALLLSLPAAGQAGLIDRVAAAVDTEVITWSELRQAVLFNERVGGGKDAPALAGQTLEGLINRALIVREARRLRFVDVLPEEVDAEVARLRSGLGSEEAYRKLLARMDVTEGGLRALLEDRLLAERFIEKKIGLLLRVNHAEALAYYERHPDEFAGRRFDEVKKTITARILGQKLDRELAAYLADLKARAEIHVNDLEGRDADFR